MCAIVTHNQVLCAPVITIDKLPIITDSYLWFETVGTIDKFPSSDDTQFRKVLINSARVLFPLLPWKKAGLFKTFRKSVLSAEVNIAVVPHVHPLS